MENSRVDNLAARLFFLTSAFWVMVTTTLGLIRAIQLAVPDTYADIPQLLYSRLRPAHVNLVVFGFVLPGLVGAALYVVPTVCRTRLFAPWLAVVSALLWNGVNLGILGPLIHGMTQGREYAELIWELDLAVLIMYALLIVCIFGATRVSLPWASVRATLL